MHRLIGLWLISAIWLVAAGLSGWSSASTAAESTPILQMEAVFLKASPAILQRAMMETTNNGTLGTALTEAEADALLQKLEAAGATILGRPQATVRSGKRAIVESAREVRYPTEYGVLKENAQPYPTAFETRNAGLLLSALGTVQPDGRVEVDLTATNTEFLGFTRFDPKTPAKESVNDKELREALGIPPGGGGVTQPEFATQKVETGFSMRAGESIVLGGLPPEKKAKSNADDPLFYVIFTCRLAQGR